MKVKRLTAACGRCAAQQVQQQRGDQRAVHDQARIALDLGDVAAVVVDAVAVEGQRRVAEQQHRVGHDARARRSRPIGAGCGAGARARRAAARRGRRCRAPRSSPRRARRADLVAAPSRTPARRCARSWRRRRAMREVRVIVSPTRSGCVKLQPPAGPHAARQRHRRQEAAALRVAVGPELAVAVSGVKYSQCHSGGASLPEPAGGSSRSSVAASPFSGAAVTRSLRCSLRPIQSRQCARSSFEMAAALMGVNEGRQLALGAGKPRPDSPSHQRQPFHSGTCASPRGTRHATPCVRRRPETPRR